MRELQIEMKTLFEKQKKAGGIIDLNENEIIILTVSYPCTILAGGKFPWGRTDPKWPSPVLESG